MIVKPEKDWKDFDQSREVVDLIEDSLVLEENKGIWQHFSFPEEKQNQSASIWSSNELSATNQVNLTLDASDSDTKIKSLALELTNNSGEHFKQLLKLKRALKNQFGIHQV